MRISTPFRFDRTAWVPAFAAAVTRKGGIGALAPSCRRLGEEDEARPAEPCLTTAAPPQSRRTEPRSTPEAAARSGPGRSAGGRTDPCAGYRDCRRARRDRA